MKIIDKIWFTEMGSTKPIGIIIGIDERTKEYKAYIGTGDGWDEKSDADKIAVRGAKFPIDIAKSIFNIKE